jgi:ATP-binding cassette subfamily B protein
MRRRYFAREVIQASAMDCGPASLKCLLEGFGIPVSYGRLREACQTDVDGTSIDTLEDIARQLGLNAEQIMLPPDHLLAPEADALPAIVVVRQPNGLTHFVVAWRLHGPWVQVMDPATGRRWTSRRSFLDELTIHTQSVPTEVWREWAGSDNFVAILRRRLRTCGVSRAAADILIQAALRDTEWKSLAALDAATRLTASLVRSKAVARRHSASVLQRVVARTDMIPAEYWSVRANPDCGGELLLRGAVLVHTGGILRAEEHDRAALPPDLAAALGDGPSRPGADLLRLLRADGLLMPLSLAGALAAASGAVVLEALLFRAFFDVGRELPLTGQRIAALAALLVFIGALLCLEIPAMAGVLRLGRRLEVRLRVAFLEKIPRLGDRYFQSRLQSDMAERSHSVHQIRHLPELGAQLIRAACELVLTAAAIAWIDPASAPVAAGAAVLGLAFPLAAQPVLTERDLRVRSHLGALSRFYLDALLGLVAIRSHGAERAVRGEHESLLTEWARAALRLQRTAVSIEAMQFLCGFGMAAWLLLGYLERQGDVGSVLLLAYWALNIPVLAEEVASAAWRYPGFRNTTLRLLEPLGAAEETGPVVNVSRVQPLSAAPHIRLHGVKIVAAGHTILDNIDLSLPAGCHVAIVGPSGAGKSSLAGILLGWHHPAEGEVLIDGVLLAGERQEQLRQETAWVDPAVHLWNRSFADNLIYGSARGLERIGHAIEGANLCGVIEKLPDGLQTRLGEGGALVSGGEGQRVRLGRALVRQDVRLAILDEPFRGLDRKQRRELLWRSREIWRSATLLCVTHDVGETQAFPRVLVIENGRIVEDGDPAELAADPGSRYRGMLDAEQALADGLWSGEEWRRIRLEQGVLRETARERAWHAV